MTPRAVELDVARLEVDDDGVTPFVWPLGRDEAALVNEAMGFEIIAAARSTAREVGDDGLVVGLLAPVLALEAAALYEAELFKRRFATMSVEPRPPERWATVRAVLNGATPPEPAILRQLRGGPGMSSWPKRSARVVRGLLLREGLSRRHPRHVDLDTEIVTLSTSPLLDAHRVAQRGPVVLGRYEYWLGPADTDRLDPATRRWVGELSEQLALRLRDVALARDVDLSPLQLRWFETVTRDAGALALAHVRALGRQRLPRRFWTGTGSTMWARLLRAAVLREGGHVTGHDHGTGSGLRSRAGLQMTSGELEGCDLFVTFNEQQVRGIERLTTGAALLQPAPPALRSIGELVPITPRPASERLVPRPGPIRTVMVVTSPFRGDHSYVNLLPDVVAVDLHARLFSALRRWGYSVLHKPHPGSSAPPPPALASRLGAEVVDEPFEAVVDRADAVLIIEDSSSTVIVSAAESGKPLVIVDFNRLGMSPDAGELLRRRAVVLEGFFDEENRAELDWAALREGIELSRDLDDPSFGERWFAMR